MESAAFAELAQTVTGAVVLPGDDAYAELSKTFVHQGSPAVIVSCTGQEDVRAALRFARDNGLEIAVRSSGHSGAGFSTNDGGLVIDLSPINHVEVVDAETGLVRLGSGARWVEVGSVLTEHHLAISSGDTTSVAVGGLLLGGGIGWLVRKHGLAIDSVQAADVVTADGEFLRASAEENPDLFWAIRGGGGNFGVVTSFEIVARPLEGIVVGKLVFPTDQAAQVVRGWTAAMATAPRELTTTIARFPSFGDTPPPLFLNICFAGTDVEAAERAIAPLLEIGDVLDKELRPATYPEVLEDASDLPEGWLPRAMNRFVPEPTDAFATSVIAAIEKLDTMYLELRSLGGALGDVPAGATAFAHRDAQVMVNVANLGTAAENVERTPQFDGFWAEIAPFTSGAYCNLISEIHEDDLKQSYPAATYARLAELKAKYDPQNVFKRNVNIVPQS
ncbi:FAD-binding oxidoreductase [Amycolatopsis sp. NPDC004747]